VCIDTFLFSAQYTDVATLAVLSKYTAGSTYFYPAFASARDGAFVILGIIGEILSTSTTCAISP
jgi:hypothetical protein